MGNKDLNPLAPYPVDMSTKRSGKCSSCTHERRGEIDRDLLEGASAPVVAERYGLNRESVRRHRVNHLHVSTVEAQTANNALTIIGYAHDLYERAVRLLDRAEASVDQLGAGNESLDGPSRRLQAAAATLREVRSSIELLAKLVVVEAPHEDESRNAALDARISEALADLVLPALGPGTAPVEDAVIVSDAPH